VVGTNRLALFFPFKTSASSSVNGEGLGLCLSLAISGAEEKKVCEIRGMGSSSNREVI